MNEQNFDVSPLALTLLEVAWNNDRQKKLIGNTAFHLALQALQTLVSACKRDDVSQLASLTGESSLPTSFLSFAASLTNQIDLKLQVKVPISTVSSDVAWTSRSDFDHSVFLALGQAMADVVWPEEPKRDLHDIKIQKVLQRLSESNQRDIQVFFLQHYLGNVLHDYFDRAQVRIYVRDLPDDVELEIRRDDCRTIAEHAYQMAEAQTVNPPTADEIQASLQLTVLSVLERSS